MSLSARAATTMDGKGTSVGQFCVQAMHKVHSLRLSIIRSLKVKLPDNRSTRSMFFPRATDVSVLSSL